MERQTPNGVGRKVCNHCTRPLSACYCHLVERRDNQHVQINILRHKDEVNNPLGTAKILNQSLSHCKIVDGVIFSPKEVLDATRECYLLYPGDGSINVQDNTFQAGLFADKKKANLSLLVLDGTWRNTREILMSNPFLNDLPRLSMGFPPSRYIVRKSPDVEMVSTVESVVYMLDELYQGVVGNKDFESFQPILKAFDYMVAYQIKRMGQDTFKKNYGAV